MDLKRGSEDDLQPRQIPERTVFPKVPVHPVVPDISLILSANIPNPSQDSSGQLGVNPSKSAWESHVISPPYSYNANQPILRKSVSIKNSVNNPNRFSSAVATDPPTFGSFNTSNKMGNTYLQFPSSKSYPDSSGVDHIDDPNNQKKILQGKPVNDPEIPSVRSLHSGSVTGHVGKPVGNERKNNVPKTLSNVPRVSSKRTLSSKMDKKVVTHEYPQKHHLCLPPEQDSPRHCQKIKSKHTKCVCDLDDSCSSGDDVRQSSSYDQNLRNIHFSGKTSIKDNQSPTKLCSESVLKVQTAINKETAEVIGKLFEVNEAQFQMMHDILVKVTNLQLNQEKLIHELNKPAEASMKCSCSSSDTSRQNPLSKKSNDSSLPEKSVLHKTTQTSPGISRVSVGIMTEQPYVTSDHDDSEKKGHLPRTTKSDSVKKLEYRSSSTTKNQNTGDESLALNDVEIVTQEQPDPSPQPSLHLDLQDFRESSEDETESNCDAALGKNCKATIDETSQEPTGAGWTLYNNVVGQVNKYLQTAPNHQGGKRSSEKEDISRSSSLGQAATSVEGIRYTTIEQIHKLGVSVYEGSTEIKEVSTTRRMKFDSTVHPYLDWQETGMIEKNTEMESSLQKDALALKYLSDDQINAAYSGQKAVQFYNLGQKCTNMSAATLQYLEKYKLLPHFTDGLEGVSVPAWRRAEVKRGRILADEADKIEGRRETGHPASHRSEVAHPISHRSNLPNQTGKILDITNLKRQPKLL